ncbi:unnamed protein product [Calicophoron daubneyi]|uniref:Uncharacterized protein n=1 Tax=Calicophoron daubneyi TaxID=300641 RepID=A0AAV2TYI9_CALDB
MPAGKSMDSKVCRLPKQFGWNTTVHTAQMISIKVFIFLCLTAISPSYGPPPPTTEKKMSCYVCFQCDRNFDPKTAYTKDRCKACATAVFELVNGERVEDRLCVDFDDVVEEHIITDSKHPMLPLKASRKYCFTNLCNSKLNVPVTDACSFYTPYSGVCRAISTWTTFLLPSLIILFTEPV